MNSYLEFAYNCSKLIENTGFKCALIGGVAVGIWTEERFTKDIDFALAVGTDNDSEKLVKKFYDHGFSIEKILEHKPTNSLAVAILGSPKNNKIRGRVDLIFMQTGIEKEIVRRSVLIKENKTGNLRVASIGDLIALKVLSMDDKLRPQDRIDLLNLLKVAYHKDLKIAEDSINLITKRGFNRQKDLLKILKKVREIK